MKDIRKALTEQPAERWKKDMAAAMPQWVNDYRQCSAAIKKGVGGQLSFVCRCSVTAERPQGKAVQVPVRWSQETPPVFASQARMLTAALEAKHGKGVCFDVLTAPDPAVQQQVIHKATAAVKRKQALVEELQEQLDEKKSAAVADVQDEIDELKHRRQAGTKARNKRAVPIVSCNQFDFDHPQRKKDALEHAEYGVEAAFRYNCAGSSKKALLLIVQLITRFELR